MEIVCSAGHWYITMWDAAKKAWFVISEPFASEQEAITAAEKATAVN